MQSAPAKFHQRDQNIYIFDCFLCIVCSFLCKFSIFGGAEIKLFQPCGPMTQQKPRVPPRLSPHFYSDFIAHRASRYAACGGRLPTSVKKRYRQSPSYRPMLSDWHDPIQQTGSRTNGRAGIRRVQFLPRPKYS